MEHVLGEYCCQSEMVKLDPRDPPWGLIPDPGSPIPGPCKKYIYHKNTLCDIERQMGVEMIMKCGVSRTDRHPSSSLILVTLCMGFLFSVEDPLFTRLYYGPSYTCPSILPAGALGLWHVRPPYNFLFKFAPFFSL